MFVYLHYNGGEPSWATALRNSGLPCYSPGIPIEQQLQSIRVELDERKPCTPAYDNQNAFQLAGDIWTPLQEAEPSLLEADRLSDTDLMVWRDQWLLTRADVLVVANGATHEIPLLSRLWEIPVVGISYTPMGGHHWFSYCCQVTINSPQNVDHILEIIGWPDTDELEIDEEPPPSEESHD